MPPNFFKLINSNNMPCALTQNYTLDCKDSLGGITEVYFIAEGDVTSTTEASGVITALVKASGKKFYKYELVKGTSQLVENVNANVQNGTIVVFEGEELAAGMLLNVKGEEGIVPAPDGVHETTTGLLVTTKDGVVEMIETKEETAVEEVEVEVENQFASVEQFDALRAANEELAAKMRAVLCCRLATILQRHLPFWTYQILTYQKLVKVTEQVAM